MTATVESTELARLDREPLGLALIRSLEDAGELQRSALLIRDTSLTIQSFEAILTVLGGFKRTLSFAIGDLLNFCEAAYTADEYGEWLAQVYADVPTGVERPGDRYDRAAAITGLKRETLRNYSSVMARVAVSRRRDTLSFGHHDAVASLEPALQTEWLLAAEEHDWGRKELRDRMHAANVLQPRQSRIEWTGGALGSIAPEIQPPTRPDAPTGVPVPPDVPEAQGTLVAASTETLELDAVVRQVVEAAVLLEGRLEGDPGETPQPLPVGLSLGEDHYIVPRTLFDQLAALVAVEE